MGVGRAKARFWQVQAVYGCQTHPGPGFAYTIGLADVGLRELHMWDQPTHGDDPGDDFVLSSADLCTILNGFADEWVAGTLQLGDVRDVVLDDGLAKAVVTFDEPVSADDVEAWGARPSMVIPLSWSLHRPARGEPVEILADARPGYERDIRATAAACDRSVPVSGAPLPEQEISFDVQARYGPLSALVAVHARAMVSIPTVESLIDNARAAETATSPRALLGRMATMSRLSGRDEQVREAERLAGRVMDRLAQRRVWRDRIAVISQQGDLPLHRALDDMRDLVTTSIRCTLVALVLDDVLPEEMALAAQGPWRATASPTGLDPGERWRCSAAAEAAVRGSFASLDSCALLDLAAFMYGPIGDLLGDDLLILEGRALTQTLAPPPTLDLVRNECRQTAAIAPVLRELTLFARMVVAFVDDELDLDSERAEMLRAVLRQRVP